MNRPPDGVYDELVNAKVAVGGSPLSGAIQLVV